MAFSQFRRVAVKGISVVLPPKEICIYDEAQYYDNNVKKIDRMRKMVGFWKRRVVDENTTPADMAIDAAQKLLKGTQTDKSTIDALIFVTQSPDYPTPASAFSIHNALGLPDSCSAFDINLGCPGWVYGMQLAHSMIESGANRRVLLLVGDSPSTKVEISDRINAPLFGDAAAATLLERSDTELETPTYFDLGADGSGYDAIITPAGGARLPLKFDSEHDAAYNAPVLEPIVSKSGHTTNLTQKQMNGMKVFNFTMTVVPKKIRAFMQKIGITESDVDRLVLHQANKQIVETVCQQAGFPLEKASYKTFEEFGNQTVTSIPAALCHTLKEKMTSPEGVKVLYSGFGIGLAWGSCATTFKNLSYAEINTFELTADRKTRSDYINYWRDYIK